MTSKVWFRAVAKKNVNVRRINKEMRRIKLQRASFINVPRLVK
jgi:hypothetical protein